MSKIYPFKFLDAYNKDDVNIFFGREEEINALYEMIFQTDILMVYGASGTGKTSLIQCGLASKFQSHDWYALNIRRGSNINASVEKALTDAVGTSETVHEDVDWMEGIMEEEGEKKNAKPQTFLEKSFKAVYLKYFRPIYLIFDQFEELYILGNKEEQSQFIQTVQEMLKLEHPIKMIFSIREEYLGYLDSFEKAVPQLLRKKLRVEPMNFDKVKKVIIGATSYKDSNVRLNETETEAFTEGIFNRIKGKEKTLTIQLPYLQVFLDKLYIEITKDESREADALFSLEELKKIGDIGDVLRDFLEEQVKSISKRLNKTYNTVSSVTIWKILSPFTTLEGTKEPISVQSLFEQLPELDTKLILDTIEAFVKTRILRYSEADDLYEIAHDSLALRIAEKRSDDEIALLEVRRLIESQVSVKAVAREWFTERQLNFIEPYLTKIKLTNEENKLIKDSRTEVKKQKRKRRKRFQLTFIGMAFALVVMIVLTVWANHQLRRAEASEVKTKRSEVIAKITLEQNKKIQALAKARELGAFGDSYTDLVKFEYAAVSYQLALDTLKAYPQEELYKELMAKLDSCKK